MRQKKTKVLEILHSLNAGGIETFIVNFLKARNDSERKSIKIDIWTLCNDKGQYFDNAVIEQGCRIIRPKIVRWTNILHRPLCFFYLAYILLRYGPYDVVHLHLHSTGALFVLLLRIFRVRKIILHSHNTSETGAGRLWKMIYPSLSSFLSKYADIRCACSAEAGKELFGSLPVKIVPNGIDTAKFAFNAEIRTKKRKELAISNGTFAVGIAGRLMEQKNHSFLLDVFKEILKIRQDSVLLIAGDGPLQEMLQNKAEMLGISKNIRFLGVRNDIAELYQSFDCFVLPSIYEGFGIVCIEAQAAGLPCIVSDAVPKSAAITNTLRLSLIDSPENWARQIIDFSGKTERKDRSGIICEKGFDRRNTSKMLIEMYLRY